MRSDSGIFVVDELLTVEDVATLLKVPRSWIYQHVRKSGAGRLPHVKRVKYLRFVESIYPACDALKMPRITWHMFRHLHGTLLSQLGVPVAVAQA